MSNCPTRSGLVAAPELRRRSASSGAIPPLAGRGIKSWLTTYRPHKLWTKVFWEKPPMAEALLNSRVLRPARAAVMAEANPAGPAPATITSYSDSIGEGSLVSKGVKEVVLVMGG